MEHGRVRSVGVLAVHLSRADHAKRRLVIVHVANLHSGRVATKERSICGVFASMEIEDVLRISRRMVLGEIEEIELKCLGLDFGASS